MKKHLVAGFAQYVVTTLPFIWVGFVCAISFMEAWLKFTVPQVTLSIGLSIGQVVFTALNRVEWSFALAVFTCLILMGVSLKREIYLFGALSILLLQTLWILPALSARADAYIAGETPPSSNVHFYFIIMEVLKAIALLIYGYKQRTLWKLRQPSVK